MDYLYDTTDYIPFPALKKWYFALHPFHEETLNVTLQVSVTSICIGLQFARKVIQKIRVNEASLCRMCYGHLHRFRSVVEEAKS